MGKPAGLTKRKGSSQYYFRMRCPKHLAGPGVRNEVLISLKTADRRQALMRLPDAREKAHRLFVNPPTKLEIVAAQPYRRWPDDPLWPLLDTADVLGMVQRYFQLGLIELDAEEHLTGALAPEALQRVAQDLDEQIAALRAAPDTEEEEDPVVGVAIGLLHEAGVRTPYASQPARLLREYLRRAMEQLLTIERARLHGDFSVTSTDPLFSIQPISASVHLPQMRHGPSSPRLVRIAIKEAADRYLKEVFQADRKNKTEERYRAEIKHIVSYFGEQTVLADLKRADSIEFRDIFAKLPPNFSKRLDDKVSIRDLAARRKPDDPVLAWETLDKYLSALNRFMRWAYKEEYTERAWDDLKPLSSKPDGSMAKFPFENDELRRIFNRPIYTGCKDDRNGFAKPGPNIVRRSRYWAPLIALFMGLRAGEILQLTPAHFRTSDAGTPFIVLTLDMRLKNENAQREIPVHPMLVRIGLLDWVARRREQPDDKLFPEVGLDVFQAESPTFSKRFRSDLKYFELGERRDKLSFHSFRHTFKRALDRAAVPEQEKDELCGWARGKKIGRRYGSGLEADVLKPHLEKVVYDLDLTHLLSHSRLCD
ncbi:phage integrase family protein [Rhizorhabdus wittichii RW1]|uniref:Phage integrase family protein n=1 Tax=Rhizorhabdus wittichii (strain DSM 6014 / CCUG 31198 / JCM 15750 / NBRC 105917 / EY 4224 / RW1) TaxID=392499 RepID=A0A9J9HC49_RHIWR|nr:phage integrase family protein [Rhizorhabdus wittichii RW1]